jgi:hypothetical protein
MMELRKNLILRSPPFETPPAAAPQDRLGRLEGRSTLIQRTHIRSPDRTL